MNLELKQILEGLFCLYGLVMKHVHVAGAGSIL